MTLDLHPVQPPRLPVALDELVAEARGFLAAAEADSTRRNYATDWRAFTAWCGDHGFGTLPADPEVVALYARDHKASTVVRRAVGIAKGHRRAGTSPPPSTRASAWCSPASVGPRGWRRPRRRPSSRPPCWP